MSPPFYRGCWHEVSRDLFFEYSHYISQKKDLTGIFPFLFHAVLLDQASAHCPKFLTAALKKFGPYFSSNVVDHPLRPTKDLWLGKLLPYQLPNPYASSSHSDKSLINGSLGPKLILYLTGLRTKFLHFTHPDATQTFKFAFDLHVSGTPLAFTLSQNQTQICDVTQKNI